MMKDIILCDERLCEVEPLGQNWLLQTVTSLHLKARKSVLLLGQGRASELSNRVAQYQTGLRTIAVMVEP